MSSISDRESADKLFDSECSTHHLFSFAPIPSKPMRLSVNNKLISRSNENQPVCANMLNLMEKIRKPNKIIALDFMIDES